MRVSLRLLTLCAVIASFSSLASQTFTESVVYTFQSGQGGFAAGVNLIQASDGNFYGASQEGGTGSDGSVFRITPSGTYTLLYSFCTTGGTTCADGALPEGGLIQGSDGNLYGTARQGGANSDGTVFRLTLAGTYKLIYTFCSVGGTSCDDGKFPQASLVQGSDGNLYGTTANGDGGGTAFKLTTAGVLTTLHTFSAADGYGPEAGLVESTAGNFFGPSTGYFYQITSSGAFTNIPYATCEPDCPDDVESTMVEGADGQFYGTSDGGGTEDDGEVFKVTSAGDITDLHSMCTVTVSGDGCGDGENPEAGLVEGSDGNFYGTAQSGGSEGHNQGTVFQVTSGGTYAALYAFCPNGSPCADGSDPTDGLVQGSDGSFYGIADSVIFKIAASPALQAPVQLNLSASSVKPGGAFTLTYTVFNAHSKTLQTCFATSTTGASGWTGAKSGSATATMASLTAPSTSGTYTYALTCGGMESGLATLTVAAAKLDPTVALTVTPNPLTVGQSSTLKATVSGSGATPTGQVKLLVGTTTVDTLTLSGGTASATVTTNGLAPGTYPLTGDYAGDANYNSATSSAVDVTLNIAPTKTTLTATPSTVTPPAGVTLQATVKRSTSGAAGTPTGSVTFYVGTTTIASAKLNGSGVASFTASTSGISAGEYPVTAKYSGDSEDATSTSAAVTVTVQ